MVKIFKVTKNSVKIFATFLWLTLTLAGFDILNDATFKYRNNKRLRSRF